MIIKLSEIINESEVTFDYVEKTMDSIDTPEGVTIRGRAFKEDNGYVVEGSYRTVLRLECVRCLTEIEPLIQGDFRAEYLDPKEHSKYASSLKPEEEFGDKHFEEATNSEISISDLVREYIILDLSQYEACLPECSDTSEVEKYSKEDVDPRWQQLLDIKF
ncbi:YceD family protein [Cetobacterium sp.]|uniref:YceD family protein n=1 Tax=Cetobacterium sp. TaxID=2071632 RepID=UPI003F40E961